MLVVSLCKPVICKLKIFCVGNLNIINQGGNLKKGRPNFNISVEGSKGGGGGGEGGGGDF